ncbi:hypothetical protein CSAL01_07003 [Colletotrichum salicis]|uniref:Uncharacterized protein n=1 Tax=Colletotrichum salicis TaxID=1209931 RepID=A0A135SZE5_9PEZI|nr:hypothetical protein CSAL01_07003 [Colletotrichum salicis]
MALPRALASTTWRAVAANPSAPASRAVFFAQRCYATRAAKTTAAAAPATATKSTTAAKKTTTTTKKSVSTSAASKKAAAASKTTSASTKAMALGHEAKVMPDFEGAKKAAEAEKEASSEIHLGAKLPHSISRQHNTRTKQSYDKDPADDDACDSACSN